MSQCPKCFEQLYACCCHIPEIDVPGPRNQTTGQQRKMTEAERSAFEREKAALAAEVAKLKNG